MVQTTIRLKIDMIFQNTFNYAYENYNHNIKYQNTIVNIIRNVINLNHVSKYEAIYHCIIQYIFSFLKDLIFDFTC